MPDVLPFGKTDFWLVRRHNSEELSKTKTKQKKPAQKGGRGASKLKKASRKKSNFRVNSAETISRSYNSSKRSLQILTIF